MERITLEIGVQTEIGKSRSLYAISNLWVSWWSEKKPHLHFIVHTPMNSNSDPGFFIFPVDFVEAVGEIHGLSWLLKDWLGPSKTFYILPLMNSVWFESRWRTSQSVWLCLAPNKMFPLTFECIWLIQSCDINREDALCALLLRRLKKKKINTVCIFGAGHGDFPCLRSVSICRLWAWQDCDCRAIWWHWALPSRTL